MPATIRQLKVILAASVAATALATAAHGANFNIPAGPLDAALDAYTVQSGVPVIAATDQLRSVQTKGVTGDLSPDAALSRLLKGTGFVPSRDSSGAINILQNRQQRSEINIPPMQLAQAAPPRAAVETVTVTSSKLGGADVQSVPIAITALSQEQLTATQTAGGPDLVKQVPNLTFSKTNFTGYNIQIRGIGTQAISVTTDPAVAVAFNDTPFIRNHFFEQEFYDVSQVEVLRGPQGTLYGRNATAGVVNVISARPTDQFEAFASADVGNYHNRRFEGMINVPVVDDRLDIRAAGEWTKRDGYSFNETTGQPIDGRDLWSSRLSIAAKPFAKVKATLVWEHFQEGDDRLRSAKQLCKKDLGPDIVDGFDINSLGIGSSAGNYYADSSYYHALLSQGCLPTSFYSPDAFETPNGQAIPFVFAGEFVFGGAGPSSVNNGYLLNRVDPYASKVQSQNLRVIESEIEPTYKVKSDVFELNADYEVTPSLKLTSQTGYNTDQLRSTEDFNRFNTAPGIFAAINGAPGQGGLYHPALAPDGVYCDPQLGCSTKMVGEDLSREHAWQFNQEIRLASSFEGPLNFSLGANFTRYQTVEDYFVFFNLITLQAQNFNLAGPGDFTHCYTGNPTNPNTRTFTIKPIPFYYNGSAYVSGECSNAIFQGTYIDPNPIDQLDGNGHNYFRSENPYRLLSAATFGEIYYDVAPTVKLTAGLRWTDDKKKFWNIPSWVFTQGGGYPVDSIVNQQWKKLTGRFNATWSPKLDFTDQTFIYASYARGYKGGGANPPAQEVNHFSPQSFATHPPTFAPEFINAYELGTKNTLLDGDLVLNGDVFYYDYKGYQISQIVDRTSINLNFDAKVKGAELESTWEPIPGLRFNFAGGYETSSVNKGQSAIDLIDRTAGNSDWLVVKPFAADTSNCVLPAYVIRELAEFPRDHLTASQICDAAYNTGGVSLIQPTLDGTYGITDFDPSTAPNNGAGFAKDLSGNQLPNTPHFTVSLGAQYAVPVSSKWTAVLRSDLYWQSNSFARIFNDSSYDRLRGWKNMNLSLTLANDDGWMLMGYVKNVFDTTAITGAFLNSDDTALTTNIFVTDPRLFGINISKNW